MFNSHSYSLIQMRKKFQIFPSKQEQKNMNQSSIKSKLLKMI